LGREILGNSMAKEQVNPNGELVNCLSCGRDTTRKDGYCSKCLPLGSKRFEHINDLKDRKQLSVGDRFRWED